MLKTVLAAGCVCALASAVQADGSGTQPNLMNIDYGTVIIRRAGCSGTLSNPTDTDYQFDFLRVVEGGANQEVAHGDVLAGASVAYTLPRADGTIFFQIREIGETDINGYLAGSWISQEAIAACEFGFQNNYVYCLDRPTPGNIILKDWDQNCPGLE